MRLVAAVVAGLCLASLPSISANPAPAKVDVKVIVTPPSGPVPAGSRGEMSLLISPPDGIHINRYPPIRLKLQAPGGIVLDSAELRQGSDVLIEDPEEASFKRMEPMRIGFAVAPGAAPGKAQVPGVIKFTYCVALSGYCAPASRDVVFDVAIAPPRTN